MSLQTPVSMQLYNRLTRYLNYLKHLPAENHIHVSATVIAEALELNDVLVRKDLASVSSGGRPKTGYVLKKLITDIEHFLGYDNCCDAVLVGVGNLGRALLSYNNFANYGFNIVAAFDNDTALIGKEINRKRIMDAEEITGLCKRMNIRIGIITAPAMSAQGICDALVAGGIRAIWNFAPVNLRTPENVAIKNEDMAASLAILTRQLAKSLAKYGMD